MNEPRALLADDCLWPGWHASGVSARVRALATTRNGGVSAAPFGGAGAGEGGLNLGRHTGDSPEALRENRRRLLALTGTPAAAWLEQIHGADIAEAGAVIDRTVTGADPVRADASVTNRANAVCVVMVADCLPVLFCDEAGRAVGAAHAGWRGLAAGIVEKTAGRVASLAGADASALHAYLGPAIGPSAFEVGEDVLDAFVSAAAASQRDSTAAAFRPMRSKGKYLADIYALARLRLANAGIDGTRVHGGTHCTVTERERFYSYRRDRTTGRMAAMIWLAD
ncbi:MULTISPECIES: peptidoglycan editing factor PgeF [unclassified Caballeronia]|uniref:peptidoglycan editing factor PgeF n=1 Tax=unclassified Caballeronia TaxID=2646786 RepID=UPI0028663C00|nr:MULTISPECIES: peptidoglycan editing factor PgeF [unclassified Caballeronia]MDR5750481.1 peptidoglycan editing factor PgeF [Caballeronia sp. LZ024]MDR5842486.1 peptidoglycan editing factor PgeF [Caballeronia sp. LZ031]